MKIVKLVVVGFSCFSLSPLCAHEGADESGVQAGIVHIKNSCGKDADADFDLGITALHNFYYGEARKRFGGVVEKDPKCGMGYWALSMSTLGNLLVSPPAPKTFAEAQAFLQKAAEVGAQTQRERDYIAALQVFFSDADRKDHRARSLAYEQAMQTLSQRYPEDHEAAIFYALALNVTALPTDKTYTKQLRAADILDKVAVRQPDHPGVLHYLIHSLDYPPLALRALPAAKRYAEVAPTAPHAQHMPSHTYSMLGEWEGSIRSNTIALAAVRDSLARQVTSQTSANISTAHYSDFTIYAHLQMAQDQEAKRVVDEMAAYQKRHDTTKDPLPAQTAFAAIPSRYVLECRAWHEAGNLEVTQTTWVYAEAITRFSRSVGASRIGELTNARNEIRALGALREAAVQDKQDYWDSQIEVLVLAATGWLAHAQGKNAEAIRLMRKAADLEDASEKHIAMENRLYPMRELLADLLLELGQPSQALDEYIVAMESTPNRFNAFYGAGRATEAAGDLNQALTYYQKLLALSQNGQADRIELHRARKFVLDRKASN